jgi:hypothetical protein
LRLIQTVELVSDDFPVLHEADSAFCSLHSNDKSDMSGRNDARDIHDCDCASSCRSGNHAFRDFPSLKTHFRPAYCMRLLYADMGHVNNKFERKTKTGRRFHGRGIFFRQSRRREFPVGM